MRHPVASNPGILSATETPATILGRGARAALAAAAAGLLTAACWAGAPAAKAGTTVKPAPSKAAKAEKEREREKKGKKGAEDLDQKFLPPEGFAGDAETGAVEGHAAWNWHLLTYPTNTLPSEPYTKALRWVRQHVQERAWPATPRREAGRAEGGIALRSDAWTSLGPKPMDMTTQGGGYVYGKVTGRFNALAVDPRTTGTPGAITAYAGAASGGFWKTTNCCGQDTVWVPLWEDQLQASQAVGAIELDPNDPDIVYAGTGDFDAADQFSEGLMKSSDGGATWTQLGADVFTPVAPGSPRFLNQNIGAIKVDPRNSDTIVVGTRFDLFLSHDAGATWTRVPFGANPTDPVDLTKPIGAIHRISGILLDASTDPTTIYVAVGFTSAAYNGDNGVYKGALTSSGLPTLTLMANGWPIGTGSGTNGATDVGRIRLAASRGNAAGNLVIYAQVQSASDLNALGTWVTTDQGQTWRQLAGSADSSYKDCANYRTGEQQDWYNLFIQADPGDDKTLYIGRVDLYKATVDPTYSSMTLADLSNVYSSSCAGYGSLHPDQHGAAWVGGSGAGGRFLVGNDGGVYLADGTPGGFTQLNDTINATQWYAGQTGADLAGGGPQLFFAGSQDNGTASWDSSNADATWQARGNGGDGFFSVFDPIGGSLTTGTWLYEYVYGRMYRSTAGAAGPFLNVATKWSGDRNAWSAPIELDLFHGTDKACKNVVYGSHRLYASADGGATWQRVFKKDLTKGQGSIISVDIAPSNPSCVVVGTDDGTVQVSETVFKGANCTQGLANTASFKCKANINSKWTNLTQNNAVLPNRTIEGVAFDPGTQYIVYAAVGGFGANTASTPGHVFACTNSGGTWTWADKTGNLPDVPARSIVINPDNPAQAFLGTDLGFYYTNDIHAAAPVWYRFQAGLPNTRINYLALDRGPAGHPYASTTLTAFTYGRGAYAVLLPGPEGFPEQ